LDEGNLEEKVYEPEGHSNTDEEVRLSNMRASVVRCLHTTGREIGGDLVYSTPIFCMKKRTIR